MLNDIKTLLKPERHSIQKSLKEGIIVSIFGSLLFALIGIITILIRSSNNRVDSFMFIWLGINWLVAFIVTLLPITYCIAFLKIRLLSESYKNKEAKRKFVIEGAILGGTFGLGIGLTFSFLHALLIESIGKGSMIGVTISTIIAIAAGLLTGITSAFYLWKQNV